MNLSYYSAAVGAWSQQQRLNVIANNIANVNTVGYKSQAAGFYGLLYQNVRIPEPTVSEARQGAGAKVEKTDVDFNPGALLQTDAPLDFMINGNEGFFAIREVTTGEVYYTRSGNFRLSEMKNGEFFLVNDSLDFVLDANMNPIVMVDQNSDADVGVFDFVHKEGVLLQGDNAFKPVDKNGAPYLVDNASVKRGALEASNVDLAREFTQMIESQRIYQMNLRMVQTTDEITGTINNLR